MAESEIEISRMDPVSLAKLSGVIYGAMSLLLVLVYVPFLLIGMAGSGATAGLGMAAGGLVAGLFVSAFLVVMYTVLGVIFGALIALVYNLAASRIGGVKLEYSKTE